MPRRPLTNYDIIKYAKDIPDFRGVFNLDDLPKKPYKNESAVINLDKSINEGTHWVAFRLKTTGNKPGKKNVCYFDSFGDLPPPKELVKYWNLGGNDKIYYNYDRRQNFGTYNCGHLCLEFLYNYKI